MTSFEDVNICQNNGLNEADRDLIDRFKTSYNAIDRHLRKVLKFGREVSFSRVLNEFEERKRTFANEVDFLKMIGNLRNVLVHEKSEPYKYLAIPTKIIVEKLEAILDKFIHPKRSIPTFQKKVDTLLLSNSLADALKMISDKDFSQFPVCERDHFKGVLTENGITRWLSHHVSNELSLVDMVDIPVKSVLEMEEKRRNFIFVARTMSVYELKEQFADHELLEVVLITENGKRDEKLMGIVSRWDILKAQY